MKFILSLALKNLTRYRRRTIITSIAIAAGLSIFIMLDALLLGMEQESERNIIWYETASAKIMTAENFEHMEFLSLKYPIDNPEKITSLLNDQGFRSTTRITFGAELLVYEDPFPADGSTQVKIAAVDPESDGDVYRFTEIIEKGKFLQKGEEGILLGSWLAEDLQADVGYPVTLLTRSRDGYYQTIDLEVTGIFNCPNPYVNRATALIPLETADYYLQMEGGVTEIAVSLPSSADPAEEAAAINQLLQQQGNPENAALGVYTWQELAYDYLQFAAAKQGGSKVILFLVFIIAAVGISNTMLMAVYERIRELGMMRALGMDDGKLRAAFILEAGGIGFIGSVFGVLIGSILTWYFVRRGIDFTFMMRDMDLGYRVAGVMYGTWNVWTIITAFIAGIVISMIIAVFPTRKVVRMEVADALHHQ